MTVRRLYVPDLPSGGGAITLAEASSRHVRVLRLRQGDEVVLFDGTNRARVVLMLAVPKGSKLDDCVRMATELGADEVALMLTERTIPRWDPERERSRVDRLTRIASEAAAQCERNDVPIVHGPRPCAAWLEAMPEHAVGVVFGARAQGALALDGTPEQVWCAVGPEGGFTDAEIASFEEAGFAVASLGTWVLRVETAVPAALTIVRDRLEPL
ncbi:MAG: 16S rRNA (uracil(1498)-N(3))-methyltransferase [Deltaproteobacteria bacterium]|nr:16S rRNA (uracil(1498)-N(3))-methyltransferase [Deltaproteobacteria bacterium]